MAEPQKPLTIFPSTVDIQSKAACKFSVDPPDPSVTWSVAPKIGEIDEDGIYTSPRRVYMPHAVVVKAKRAGETATAVINLSDTSSRVFWLGWYAVVVGGLLAIAVLAGWNRLFQTPISPLVIVNPQIITLDSNAEEKFPFTATTLGDSKNAVRWSVDRGDIDSIGILRRPADKPDKKGTKEVLKVTATSLADPSRSGTATVLITGKHLEIMPQLSSVLPSQQVPFRTNIPKVEWTVNRPEIASISSDGFFTAGNPEKPELVQVNAKGEAPDERAALLLMITPLNGVSDARNWPLMLFVMVCGALGSMVYYATSFVGYVGNRTFCSSWFWFYISRPFVGGALAVIFFFIALSGMLSGNTGTELTKIGMISALVGLFSDKAAKKLSDVFDVLLATKDDRKDKLDPAAKNTPPAGLPTIISSVPASIPPNQEASVEIRGTNLKGPGFKLKVAGDDVTPTNHTEQSFTVAILAAQAKEPSVQLIVTTDKGTVPFTVPVKA